MPALPAVSSQVLWGVTLALMSMMIYGACMMVVSVAAQALVIASMKYIPASVAALGICITLAGIALVILYGAARRAPDVLPVRFFFLP